MNIQPSFLYARLITVVLLALAPTARAVAPVFFNGAGPLLVPAALNVSAAPLAPDVPKVCGGAFAPVADASTSKASPDTNFGSATHLILLTGAAEQNTWLDFEISGALPLSATIYSAELQLTVFKAGGTTPQLFKLASAMSDWTEAAITWNTQPAQGPAGTPVISDTLVAGDVLRVDITTLVTQWATGTATEHGLVLLPDSAGLDVEFYSRENGTPALSPQLVVKCAHTFPELPTDQSAKDAAQKADIDRLKTNSTTAVTLDLERGAVRFASFTLPIPSQYSKDPLAAAQWFLDDYHALLRLDETTKQLQLSGRSRDGNHLTFRRVEQGIPIFPADLTVHIGGGHVLGLSGRYATDVTLDPTPRLPAYRAEALALAVALPDAILIGDTQQRYIDMGRLGFGDGALHTGWAVHLADANGARTVYVDGDTGHLLYSDWREFTEFDLDVRHAHNGNTDNVWCYNFNFENEDTLEYNEHGAAVTTPDADTTAAYFSMRAIDLFWRATLGRNSLDGRGGQEKLFLHAGPTLASGMNWRNASYSAHCNQMEFGEVMSTRDIIAHEYTHGVVNHTVGLRYVNESGALDESYADIFARLVDNDDWTIGEGSFLGVFRDMSNPPAQGHPDHMLAGTSGDGQGLRVLPPGVAPDCIANDCGFVHTNSGIHNKVGFLLIQGGAFNGFTITPLGPTKTARLFYGVLGDRRLGVLAQFIDARNAAVSQAELFASTGTYGFTNLNVCQVRNAYAAVGLGVGDLDCDGTLDVTDFDLDGDAVPNGPDNCDAVSNPGQQNLDGDSQGDACDSDRDNDGLLNVPDNCPLAANAGQEDADNDGVGNACDDTDHDGLPDTADNCPLDINRNQLDIDGDGLGNVCDTDRDGDGVANGTDNSPDDFNPGQADWDSDGIGDVSDLCRTAPSPINVDTDHDGQGNPCDRDDDDDDVDDYIDNCPLVVNPDQWDGNGNNIGRACDQAEQEAFLDEARQLGDNLQFAGDMPLELPLPVCLTCLGDYLPNNFLETVSIMMPAGFSAMVVDSEGTAVARSVDQAAVQHLTFAPLPYAGHGGAFGGQGLSVAAGELPLGPPAADGVRYYLQLFPAASSQVGQSYAVTVTLTSRLDGAIYFPLIKR